MRLKKLILIAVAGALLAGMAKGQEKAAIIIGNRNYDTLRDVAEANRAFLLSQNLRRQGFQISNFRDASTAAMRQISPRIEEILDRATEVVVFVSGHVSSNQRDAWLLPTDAFQASTLVPGQGGLSLGSLMDIMSKDGGSAVLLVGEATSPFIALGTAQAGFGTPDIPQGVTVFVGPTDDLVALAGDSLLVPNSSYADAARSAGRSVRSLGFLGTNSGLLSGQAGSASQIPSAELEAFRFAQAREAGTVEALTEFLSRYPSGEFSEQARGILAELQKTPQERARDVEIALALTRAQRREIQTNLTLTGFDTNGVDGILGRGSRNAISRWQNANGQQATGYLTAEQIAAIELQALAERQRIERADAAYWRETGRLGTVPGFRAYLNRYPNGIFADLARSELAQIEGERQNAQEAMEWQRANAANTAAGYRDFLQLYPNGQYAADAEQRLNEIVAQQQDSSDLEAARAEERQLLGNPITRLLVERRLEQIGYKPGAVDGNFDRATRVAIRQFQQAENMSATGIIDRVTLARLLNN